MGPMAEDFFYAFRLGTGNTSIGVQDLASVSLAAIRNSTSVPVKSTNSANK
jgi:hypothetical protein